MAWLKLTKPGFIVGSFLRGLMHGSIDEIFTDA